MAPSGRASNLAVVSWVIYDLALTVFSVSILSFFFPIWIGDELGAGADFFNYITAASMLLVVLTAPVFGAIADMRQSRKPFLIVLTVLAAAATAIFDVFGTVVTTAALFVAANFAFQSAQIFYNSLLPSVAMGRNTGRISGYGTATGYTGAILVLVLFTALVTSPEAAKSFLGPLGFWIETDMALSSNVFVPTAVLFLLFSLPVFFFVPDSPAREPRPVGVRQAYRGVLQTVRNIRRYPGLGLFIVATILYTDAANTIVTNVSLYGRVVFGMSDAQIRNLLILSTAFGVLGAVAFGFLTDKIGPKRSLVLVLACWLVAVAVSVLSVEAWMLIAAGPLMGVSIGATWVVSRVMLISLSPPERLGEFFGFYILAGRLSAVTGPALTGALLTVFSGLGPGAYRLALLSMSVTLTAALILTLRLPDSRPTSNASKPSS